MGSFSLAALASVGSCSVDTFRVHDRRVGRILYLARNDLIWFGKGVERASSLLILFRWKDFVVGSGECLILY